MGRKNIYQTRKEVGFLATVCYRTTMVRILYGLCGEGLGHASRSRILINHLKKNGHDIRIVAGNKAYRYLSKEFEHVYEIESAQFIYKGGQASLFRTILWTLYRTMVSTPHSFLKIKKIIKEFDPELLITDAEPISHAAARLSGIKRMSIDNPQALLYRKYKVKLGEYLSWFILFIAIKVSMLGADKYIIYDFSDEQPDDPRLLFLKPLIQDGILKQKPTYGDHVFVYQTLNPSGDICKMLKNIDETFIIYGSNKDLVDENLVFKTFNDNEFYQDIANAKAIITNGGFTVISEALYLKKPIYSLPINHQFEQVVNGKFVEQLGAGVYHKKLSEEKLRNFLANLDIYHKNLKMYDPGTQTKTLARIEKEIQALLPKKTE